MMLLSRPSAQAELCVGVKGLRWVLFVRRKAAVKESKPEKQALLGKGGSEGRVDIQVMAGQVLTCHCVPDLPSPY